MSTRAAVAGMALLLLGLHPARVAADPMTITGDLSASGPGFRLLPELNLAFPNFHISLVLASPLSPGFTFNAVPGTPVPFTQSTGAFSGHSQSLDLASEVSGSLSFVGSTQVLQLPPGAHNESLIAPVQLSGLLRIVQDGHVLFDGTLLGIGTGQVSYEDRFNRNDWRVEGYVYTFTGVAATPEPASFVLLGSGVAWLLSRRRTKGSAPA